MRLELAEGAPFVGLLEDEVGQGVQVALELRGALDGVEVRADVFGFDVSHNEAALEHGEVGRAASDARRFVDRLDTGIGLEQDRQGGSVGVLGRCSRWRFQAGGEQLAQLGQVGGDGLGHRVLSTGRVFVLIIRAPSTVAFFC